MGDKEAPEYAGGSEPGKLGRESKREFYELRAGYISFRPGEDPRQEWTVDLGRRLLRGVKDIRSFADVGCGDGAFMSSMLQLYPGAAATGIDLSRERLRRAAEFTPAARFAQGSILDIPLYGDAVDLCIATEVLEHLKDVEAGVRELRRVTRKYVLATTPFNEKLEIETCPHCLRQFIRHGHVRSFTRESFAALFEGNGLRVAKLLNYRPFDVHSRSVLMRTVGTLGKRLFFPWKFADGGFLGALCLKV